MKFFAVFAALIAVTCASPSSWTLNQLSEAIQSPHTNPAYLPSLENALNEMMSAIYAGEHIGAVSVSIPSVDYSTWTLGELSDALMNPETSAADLPGLEQALNQMMEALHSGAPVVAAGASTVVPAQDLSFWTLAEISDALESPATSPVMVPYLVDALNHMMEVLISGEQMEFVVIATPAGLLPAIEAEVPVAPVGVAPVAPVDAAPVAPAAPSSPLVQIIINIKQESASVDVPAGPAVVAPAPVIVDDAPAPVTVVDEAAEIIPSPVVAEQAPEAVIIVDNSPIVASPVVVSPENPGLQPDPETVAHPGLQPDPEVQPIHNPIDVIAVNA